MQKEQKRLKSKIKRINNYTIQVDQHCIVKYDGIWKTLFVEKDMTGYQWLDFFEFLHKEMIRDLSEKPQVAVDKLLKELGIPKSN